MLINKQQNTIEVVTVAVITYHSAVTVLETLDSIVNQTYGPENIELIISDDGSKDNTVQVIDQWLAKYQSRFYNVSFLANAVNGGISKNCNVAWKAATSKWIKTIAGDDFLLSDCLVDNMSFVEEHKNEDVAVVFSKMQPFTEDGFGNKIYRSIFPSIIEMKFFSLSAAEQFEYLQVQAIGGAPTALINRDILIKTGFSDERFSMMEDFPLWFKITKAGFRLHFMNRLTVCYRIGDSVSKSKTKLVNELFLNDIIRVERDLVIPSLDKSRWFLILRKRLWPKFALKVAHMFNNRVTVLSRVIILSVFSIRPGFLRYQLNKMINKYYIDGL